MSLVEQPEQISVPLSKQELDTILASFPESAKQERRFIEYLAKTKNPNERLTVRCNVATLAGNLSHTARMANTRLHKHGFMIACQRPINDVYNRLGEPSNMYVWSLYRIAPAANDDHYHELGEEV